MRAKLISTGLVIVLLLGVRLARGEQGLIEGPRPDALEYWCIGESPRSAGLADIAPVTRVLADESAACEGSVVVRDPEGRAWGVGGPGRPLSPETLRETGALTVLLARSGAGDRAGDRADDGAHAVRLLLHHESVTHLLEEASSSAEPVAALHALVRSLLPTGTCHLRSGQAGGTVRWSAVGAGRWRASAWPLGGRPRALLGDPIDLTGQEAEVVLTAGTSSGVALRLESPNDLPLGRVFVTDSPAPLSCELELEEALAVSLPGGGPTRIEVPKGGEMWVWSDRAEPARLEESADGALVADLRPAQRVTFRLLAGPPGETHSAPLRVTFHALGSSGWDEPEAPADDRPLVPRTCELEAPWTSGEAVTLDGVGEGTRFLRLQAAGFLPLQSDVFVVADDGLVSLSDLVLEHARSLEGRVVDAHSGRAVEGARVVIAGGEHVFAPVRSGADGHFRIGAAPKAALTIVAEDEDHPAPARSPVPGADEHLTLLRDLELPAAGDVEVEAVGPEGLPISSLSFVVLPVGDHPPVAARTDPGGWALVTRLPVGTARLVSMAGEELATVEVRADERSTVRLNLGPAILWTEVLDHLGRPVRSLVSLASFGPLPGDLDPALAFGHSHSVPGLRAGSNRVTVTHAGVDGAGPMRSSRFEVVLPEGEMYWDEPLVIQSHGEPVATPLVSAVVGGRVTEVESGRPIENAFVLLPSVRGTRTDGQGRFALPMPSDGIHRLVAELSSHRAIRGIGHVEGTSSIELVVQSGELVAPTEAIELQLRPGPTVVADVRGAGRLPLARIACLVLDGGTGDLVWRARTNAFGHARMPLPGIGPHVLVVTDHRTALDFSGIIDDSGTAVVPVTALTGGRGALRIRYLPSRPPRLLPDPAGGAVLRLPLEALELGTLQRTWRDGSESYLSLEGLPEGTLGVDCGGDLRLVRISDGGEARIDCVADGRGG